MRSFLKESGLFNNASTTTLTLSMAVLMFFVLANIFSKVKDEATKKHYPGKEGMPKSVERKMALAFVAGLVISTAIFGSLFYWGD